MMNKYQNKYRIPSARLKNWNYGDNGAYFITICTDKMQCVFGDVLSDAVCATNISTPHVEKRFIASPLQSNCEMQLNELGKIAHEIWQEIPNKFPFVELGNFIIMPNHMHGILIINKLKIVCDEKVETRFIASEEVEKRSIASEEVEKRFIASEEVEKRSIAPEDVETRLIASVPDKNPDHDDNDNIEKGGFAGNKNPMLNENISRIIRWYKGRCSFEMRKIKADFNWQARFYDNIIRDSRAFDNIQNYIENNPSKWIKDKFFNKI